MKWLCLTVMVVLAMSVSGELLNALNALQQSDKFETLSAHDQVILTDVVAAAETCKLSALEQSMGRPVVLEVLSHLPVAEEHKVERYLLNHLAAEANGTCVMQ